MLEPVLILLLVVSIEQSSCQGDIAFPKDDLLFEGDSCTLADGATGMCRRAEECEAFLKSIPQKAWKQCSFVGKVSIVCCRRESPSVLQGSPNRIRSGFMSERICDGFPEAPEVSDHILDGAEADMDDFPYLGALAYGIGSDVTYRCGASLISREYALTAAHCMIPERPVFLRLGVVTIFGIDYPNDKPVDVGIVNITMHPNYSRRPLSNDIALLKLNRTVDEPFLIPACLYTNSSDPSPDVSLSIAGWGSTVPDPLDFQMSPDLRKATVNTFDRAECDHKIRTNRIRRSKIEQLNNDLLCAVGRNATGHNTADTCTGDSGGPLELTKDRRKYIVGITSSGKLCGSKIPGIYTRVSHYIDWIEKIVWPV